jgi:PhnB protein
MAVQAVPPGYHTITPYLAVRDAARLIDFLKQAFDAKAVETVKTPDGAVMHAEVQVGDSKLMIGQMDPKDLGERNSFMPAMLYMYVSDVDAVYKKAVEAGGKVVMEPIDQFYGDRSGAIEDMAGNQWWIATHKEDMSADELARRASQRKG